MACINRVEEATAEADNNTALRPTSHPSGKTTQPQECVSHSKAHFCAVDHTAEILSTSFLHRPKAERRRPHRERGSRVNILSPHAAVAACLSFVAREGVKENASEGSPRTRVLGRSTVTERNPAGKWIEKISPFARCLPPFSLARSVRVRLQSETKVIMTNFILDQLPISIRAGGVGEASSAL